MKKLYDHFLVRQGEKVHLKDKDADYSAGLKNKEEAAERLAKNRLKMAELQRRLFAEDKQSLLMVLQAMDAGGKDGTIRHVMKGINPQSCRVTNFRAPSSEERKYWDDYMRAFEDVLSKCSTKQAPWFVISSDKNGSATWSSPRSWSEP